MAFEVQICTVRLGSKDFRILYQTINRSMANFKARYARFCSNTSS